MCVVAKLECPARVITSYSPMPLANHMLVEFDTRGHAAEAELPRLYEDHSPSSSFSFGSIASAHIATFGERAVGVYYVTDAGGGKVTRDQDLRDLRGALKAALEGVYCETGEAAE